ncbi:FtsX-like permease family protein [Granulicella paludicola]|uniref:FtsX-like permease family protein n=1 Tax=Granulicella paludicola TaxID=474951 RepID=UPI0021E05A0C|nr:FtsX-like permease family protein [Granulicella paludicola]
MARFTKPLRGLSARRLLILESLRENPPQTLLNALSFGCTVAIMLALFEVSLPLPHRHMWVISFLRWLIEAIAWFALLVSLAVMSINRVSQVRERTRQFAILRMLGSSFTFIGELLMEETFFVAIPGTLIGVALGSLLGYFSASGVPDTFAYQVDYGTWYLAGCFTAMGYFGVGVATAWVITRQQDVLSALSSK